MPAQAEATELMVVNQAFGNGGYRLLIASGVDWMISGTRYQFRLEVNRQLRLSGEVARSLAEISSGKKILAPSDDPAAAARISDIGRSQANHVTWRANLDKAAALSRQADDVLKSVSNVFTRAAELMVAGSSQTLSAGDRQAIALEISSLHEQLVTLRDSRDSRGELLFPRGQAIAIPVGADLELVAVDTRDAVFDAVPEGGSIRDLEGILMGAASALSGGNSITIRSLLGEVNAAVSHVASFHAQHGARGNRIDDLIEQSESFGIVMEEERKSLESADITEVIAKLQAKELSLEAAQAAFARINRSNLFDLLA